MKKPTERIQRMIAGMIMAAVFTIVLAVGMHSIAEGNEMLSREWQPAQFIMAPHAKEREALGGGLPWATINASGVNFRKGPGLNSDVCCQWSYGVAVEVIGEKNGWYECLHWTCPEHVWIWGEYLDFR